MGFLKTLSRVLAGGVKEPAPWPSTPSAVAGLLERLTGRESITAQEWKSIREEIHEQFNRATTVQERVVLLDLHKAMMDLVKTSIAPDQLSSFETLRLQDFRLLVVTECMVGDELCPETLDEVTRREVAAGRMSPDGLLLVPLTPSLER